MGRIANYNKKMEPNDDDILVGSSSDQNNKTKNFRVKDIYRYTRDKLVDESIVITEIESEVKDSGNPVSSRAVKVAIDNIDIPEVEIENEVNYSNNPVSSRAVKVAIDNIDIPEVKIENEVNYSNNPVSSSAVKVAIDNIDIPEVKIENEVNYSNNPVSSSAVKVAIDNLNINGDINIDSISTTQTAEQLNVLADGLYFANGAGVYNISISNPTTGVTVANGKITVESGYSVSFNKKGNVWSLSSSVKIPTDFDADQEFNIISEKAIANKLVTPIYQAMNKENVMAEEVIFDNNLLNKIAWINTLGRLQSVGVGSTNKHSDFIFYPKGTVISGKFYTTNSSNAISFYSSANENSYVTGVIGLLNDNTTASDLSFTLSNDGYIRLFSAMDANRIPSIKIKQVAGTRIIPVLESINTSEKWDVVLKDEIKKDTNKHNFTKGWLNSANGTQIVEPNSSVHFMVSSFIKVNQGDKFYYSLYGDNNNIAIAFYSSNALNSFQRRLLSYPGGNGQNSIISGILEIQENGYILVHYRYNQGSPADKIYFLDKPIEDFIISADAQYLYENSSGSNQNITEETYLSFGKINFGKIYFDGQLPTDATDVRTPTELTFKMYDDNRFLFAGKCELSIQGHGSATYPKKGYTFDLLNANNESLEVKFGDMVAVDSFHLKAYYTDRTHARDVGSCKMWRDMVSTLPYPLSKVNNKPIIENVNPSKNDWYISDANYFPNGFPVAFYLNGQFYGLYTLRHKKTRQNYALDNANLNHIFLDSSTYSARLNEPFDYTDWDVKSPKMSGYDEAQSVPNETVLASINRLFGFTNNIVAQKANHAEFIVLKHWLQYVIFCEVIGNWDVDGNNVNIITWNGLQWSILPYDLDQTIGLENAAVKLSQTGIVMKGTFWSNFRSAYLNEIKEEYTRLRNIGFLNTSNLMKYYINQTKAIPREVYHDNKTIWGQYHTTTEPMIEHIFNYIESRITYLDTQWKLS